MIDKQRIRQEADAFFDWPTPDKSYVTTQSALIFAGVIAEMARKEERELKALICSDCGGPIGLDRGPKDGWQLEDGRTLCHACCAQDTRRVCVLLKN